MKILSNGSVASFFEFDNYDYNMTPIIKTYPKKISSQIWCHASFINVWFYIDTCPFGIKLHHSSSLSTLIKKITSCSHHFWQNLFCTLEFLIFKNGTPSMIVDWLTFRKHTLGYIQLSFKSPDIYQMTWKITKWGYSRALHCELLQNIFDHGLRLEW